MSDHPKRRIRDRRGPSTTLVAAGIRFDGTFSGNGDLLVNGTMEGNCDLDGTVTLSQGGQWQGCIVAGDVIVLGEVRGDITARNRVEIGETARIDGTVTGAEIAVAEGAVIDGSMHTHSDSEPLQFKEKRAE